VGSILSEVLQKATGIPPIDFRKKKGAEEAAKALSIDGFRQLLRQLDDEDFELMEMLVELEGQRRARDARAAAGFGSPETEKGQQE
jgi:hypothetical protein